MPSRDTLTTTQLGLIFEVIMQVHFFFIIYMECKNHYKILLQKSCLFLLIHVDFVTKLIASGHKNIKLH